MAVAFSPGKRAAVPPFGRMVLALAIASLGATGADARGRPGTDVAFVRPAPRVERPAAAPAFVVRRRAVDLDLQALRVASRKAGGRLRFDLFDDVVLRGTIERVDRRGTRGLTIGGRIDREAGSFLLVVEEAQLSGSIRLAERQFVLGADADGRAVVEEIDPDNLPECAGAFPALEPDPRPATRLEGEAPRSPEATEATAPDASDQIDVLVVYTGRAETAAGGPGAARALAQRAVDEANVAYANSGIATRLRLVGPGRTEYDETQDGLQTHLTRLAGTGDGFMDEVHALRDATGADVVSLFVDDPEGAGVGYLMQTESTLFSYYAFSVVYHLAASNNLTLPHEIAHNQGCEHDRDHAAFNPVANDAYGKRFVGNDGRPYRTVMGYPPGQRIPNFSNPAVFYQGQPTGRANKENNARVIDATAETVANFRLARRHPGSRSDFDGNGADDLATFDPVSGTWWIGLARPPSFDTIAWGTLAPSASWEALLRGDFDGDGWKDLAGFDATLRQWWISRSRGDRFEAGAWLQDPAGGGWLRHVAADFDGDGKDDVASLETAGGMRVGLSNGSAFVPSSWGTLANPTAWTETIAGDYNGDGRDDLAHYNGVDGAWWVGLSNGSGFTTTLWDRHETATGWGAVAAGDFNGDGRTDLAHVRAADHALWVEASSGTAFVPAVWALLPSGGTWGPFFAGDFDDDGLDDVAAFEAGEARWWVGLSTAAALAFTPWSTLQPLAGWTRHEVGDFDGDGKLDVADYLATTGEWWVGLSTGASFQTSPWARFVLPHGDTDTDGDGLSDADDCDPTAADVWAPPGEAAGLVLEPIGGPGSATRLRWEPPAFSGGAQVSYDVLRSDFPWYFGWGSAVCLETNDAADREAIDAAPPLPIWYYLIQTGNACGEGSLGAESSGAPRHGLSCP